MSRAFMKESDDEPLRAPGPPQRSEPLVLTRRGIALVRERLAAAPSPDEKIRLEAMLEDAVPAPPPDDPACVSLGASVTVRGIGAGDRTFDIATEEEVDVENGRLGIESPLARALLGKRTGDKARWERPIGDAEIEIIRIAYE
ncbi:MAG: GreA/GreB family elongation factor [Vulcanimicrobiaceae bacterium]